MSDFFSVIVNTYLPLFENIMMNIYNTTHTYVDHVSQEFYNNNNISNDMKRTDYLRSLSLLVFVFLGFLLYFVVSLFFSIFGSKKQGNFIYNNYQQPDITERLFNVRDIFILRKLLI